MPLPASIGEPVSPSPRPDALAGPAQPAAAPQQGAAAPVIAPQPPAAIAPVTPTAAPAPTAAPNHTPTLDAQLARPLFTLATAGRGEHVMTVHVTPDTLGPVTVRAHVGAEGVRVELFAPTDAGRDALRAILPDLRRDFSGSGLSGSLDLSSQNQPAPQQDAQDRRAFAFSGPGEPHSEAARGREQHAATASLSPVPGVAGHSIDLIV
jgi:flagellar hook-length control protein FliK